MAGIEALRHGLAIVGSRIGGLMDVVADGRNGLLCELTPEDFAKGLRGVLEKPDQLLAMRSSSLVKARDFNLPERLDDYEQVLECTAR